MIIIKNKQALLKMREAGKRLAALFQEIASRMIVAGMRAWDLEVWIAQRLSQLELQSKTKGYKGYKYVSCISVNDEVVHGLPTQEKVFKNGDVITVDICASWKGYCADMARSFVIGTNELGKKLIDVALHSLEAGLCEVRPGNHLSDISAAIQGCVEGQGFGVVRSFAGHGVGKYMHEDPEILNYGKPHRGPRLRQGMTLAIEPMITAGHYDVHIMEDGWTVKTVDGSLAAHVEDTVAVTEDGYEVLTRAL
ncbi:MAG: type I methionyl aminopeptidase [Candidatus Babeliales bacterium]